MSTPGPESIDDTLGPKMEEFFATLTDLRNGLPEGKAQQMMDTFINACREKYSPVLPVYNEFTSDLHAQHAAVLESIAATQAKLEAIDRQLDQMDEANRRRASSLSSAEHPIERIGPRVRQEVLDRYVRLPQPPVSRRPSRNVEEWALEDRPLLGDSTIVEAQSSMEIHESRPSGPANVTIPDVARLHEVSLSWSDWLGISQNMVSTSQEDAASQGDKSSEEKKTGKPNVWEEYLQ